MTKDAIVARVNQLITNGLYSFDEMQFDLDDAIIAINDTLQSDFPFMSTFFATPTNTDYTIIPERYIRSVIINYTVAILLKREGELGVEFSAAMSAHQTGLSNMFRDYFSQVPVEYQSVSNGFFVVNPDVAVEVITFDSNGGSEVLPVSVTFNYYCPVPRDPDKSGYTFDGWFVDAALTTEFDFTQPVRKTQTLYAKWTEV